MPAMLRKPTRPPATLGGARPACPDATQIGAAIRSKQGPLRTAPDTTAFKLGLPSFSSTKPSNLPGREPPQKRTKPESCSPAPEGHLHSWQPAGLGGRSPGKQHPEGWAGCFRGPVEPAEPPTESSPSVPCRGLASGRFWVGATCSPFSALSRKGHNRWLFPAGSHSFHLVSFGFALPDQKQKATDLPPPPTTTLAGQAGQWKMGSEPCHGLLCR